jgi:hypothetical protein
MAVATKQPSVLLAPRGGLRLDMPADLISDLELSDCRCVRFDQGCVSKWPGSRRLGSNLPLSGAMVGLDLFTLLSGTEKLIGLSRYDGYVYNTVTGYWETVTKATELEGCEAGFTAGTSVTVTHDSTVKVRGSYSLKMVLTAGRSDGDQLAYKDIGSADISTHNSIGFWIRSSATLAANAIEIVVSESNHASGEKTGTYVECLATALVADTWTFVRLAKTLTSLNAVISVSVYANATLASGLIVYLDDVRAYTPFTGVDSNYFSFGTIRKTTETDLWWVATNGVDPLLKWTGTGVLSNLITSYPTGLTSLLAKYLLSFKDYILLLNVTEQGNPYTQRVRWCDTATPDDFLNGNASYQDLPGPGALVGGIEFKNDYALLLRTDSLYLAYATGDTSIFEFNQVSGAIGSPAGRTVVNLDDSEVLFLGQAKKSKILDVYAFDGSGVNAIGGKIRKVLSDQTNRSQITRAFAFAASDNKEYWLVLPGAGQSYCNEAWVFNTELRSWSRGNFAKYLQCASWWARQTSLRWCDLVGSWKDQNWRWCDAGPTSGAPMALLGDNAGYVYESDPILHNEDVTGTDDVIDGWFSTKDFIFTALNQRQRITRLDLWYRGSSLDVDYSINGGSTWTSLGTLAASGTVELHHLWPRVDCNRFRLRFRNLAADGWFDFQEGRIWWRPAGGRLK